MVLAWAAKNVPALSFFILYIIKVKLLEVIESILTAYPL